MYKFNDKLIYKQFADRDGKGIPVTVVSAKLSPNAQKVRVESNTGERMWVEIAKCYTIEEWQSQKVTKAVEAVEAPFNFNILDPAQFAQTVLALDEPETIKEMCDKLCDRVFPMAGSHNPKSRSDKLNRLGFNKLFREAENLVEGKNAFYQTKQDGSLWLRHLYFKYTGIADTNWAEINTKGTEKVKAILADQVRLDIAKYEESAVSLLASDRIWEIGAGLIAASGRRPSEVAICGEFEESGDGLIFSGQAKKRGNDSEAYPIPLIGCTPELFLKKLKIFRNSPEVRRYADRDDLREATSPINTQINRLGIIPTFGWLPVPGDKSNPTCSDLRAAWVTIVEAKFKPEGKYSLLFRSEMLGHTLKVEGVAALYSRYSLREKPCSEPSNYLPELEVCASDLNPSEDLNLQELVKSPNQLEPSTAATGLILQLSQTSEVSEEAPESLIASLEVLPAKIYPDAENGPDSMESNLLSGGKCSESSRNASPVLWDGRMLRERCLADVEKLLPASEWLATKSKAQSLFRQGSLELPTDANGSLLLPTPTTYPKGSKLGGSPAGRNNLENRLRSLLPTPRANDGTQGHNTGKTGGMNITGLLKRDRLLMPGEMANPQIWGWMMGFPENWCESVLMPDGLRILADLDGGSDRSPLPELGFPEKILPVDENPSAIMGPPVFPPSASPLRSESSISPIAQESDDTPVIEKSGSATSRRHEHDFYETPPWLTLLTLANVPLSGKILEPCVGPGAIASILEMAGLEIASNDIDPAKPADFHLDATLPESWAEFPEVDWVITNPPYADMSAPIVKLAYAHAAKGIVMVLRQNWAEACEDRREFLAAHPPTMQISVPRYCYRKGANGKWATDQCPTWIYVWDKADISGLTKIITLWDDLIPLFHRTPDGIPSDEAIAAEVARIVGTRSEVAKVGKPQSLAVIGTSDREQEQIDKLLEANQALGDGRFYVSQTLIKRLLKCRDQTANLLLRLNKVKIDVLNKGINHTINRGREAELDKLISSLIS